MSWGRLCTACKHLTSDHRWNPRGGGSTVAGPYRCLHCDCSIAQDAPSVPISEEQYNRRSTLEERRRRAEANR